MKSRVHCVCSRSGGLLILGVFFTIISRDAICWGWTVIPDTHQFPLPAEPWRGHFLPHWSPGRYSSRSPQSEHQRWTALRSWTQNNGLTGKEVGQGKAASTAEDRFLSSHHTVGKLPSVQRDWMSDLQIPNSHGKQDRSCSFEVKEFDELRKHSLMFIMQCSWIVKGRVIKAACLIGFYLKHWFFLV